MRLNDIVQRHRDELEVALATAEDLAATDGAIEGDDIAATLDDWWAIAIRDLTEDRFLLVFYGENPLSGKLRQASGVRTIDLDRNLIQTGSAIYSLGQPGQGDPPVEVVLDLCSELHRRGLGERFGVPVTWER